MQWYVGRPGRLLWREWGDESVVFDCDSGAIHVMNRTAGAALRILERAPRDTTQLANQLALALDVQLSDSFCAEVDQMIAGFDELGLIEART